LHVIKRQNHGPHQTRGTQFVLQHQKFTSSTTTTTFRAPNNEHLPVNHSHIAIMSEAGDVEVEVPQTGNQILPKDVTAEIGSIKLFNKWTYEDVEIRDISLT